MYIQVDGLQKEVSGDRKLRLHTARITSGIMNAVGSMHRHGHSHTAGRTLSIIYRPTMSTRNYNFPLVSYFLFVTRLPHIASPARTVPKYCDECVCLSVCPTGYLRNHTRSSAIFCACCLCPWLGPPPACLR